MDPKEYIIPLKDYLDRLDKERQADLLRIVTQQRELAEVHANAHAREHAMVQNALDKAEAAMNKRLESMNEFRTTLTDQATTFVRREMIDAQREAEAELRRQLSDRITKLESKAANQDGRLWAMGVAITAALTLLGLALKVFDTFAR